MHRLARIPAAMAGLGELALDLRWSWNHAADSLWRSVDPELWEATGNPWLVLQSVSRSRLVALARSRTFRAELEEQLAARHEALSEPSWFATAGPKDLGTTVAYFSMEFGLSEALPIYSGGLGILAGDLLKTASDLGVPLVGIGLLYQCGYFRQALDPSGEQLAFYPYSDPLLLPLSPLRDAEGEWLHVDIELPGRKLVLRGWEARVGRTRLLLLDANDPRNSPRDRGITGELYGGGPEMRLQQELVLGIGGWRLLEALGIDCGVCHLNEGHAAFVVLERARSFMAKTGLPFAAALRCTRAGNLFTTHTPVAAGFDRFDPPLAARYLAPSAAALGVGVETLLALGRTDPANAREPFHVAFLALRGAGRVNGVSRLHGEVSRELFQPLFPRWPLAEVPVGHVTNGVHVPSWDSAAADALWTGACGKSRWLGDLETVEEDLRRRDPAELWALRTRARSELVTALRARLARQRAAQGADEARICACASVFDPEVLTVGFARRFATYKRPDLLLSDPARLERLLTHPERPVQLVVAGKAHPRDEAGRRLVQAWAEFCERPELCCRAVFLEDYDMSLAAELVQGVDVWINTPRRPFEASGTSGMKLLVNGGLNLSELDGWWAEAWAPGVGWSVGDGREHRDDPGWDAFEAREVYRLLEEEVVPAFHDRDPRGVPVRWVELVRASMASLTPRFSSNRMLREYVERWYRPCALAWRARSAENGRRGAELEAWAAELGERWGGIRIGNVRVESAEGLHRFTVDVELASLPPGNVAVELYAEPGPDGVPVRAAMRRQAEASGTAQRFVAEVPADRPAAHYTPRVVPYHDEALVPLEAPWISWAP